MSALDELITRNFLHFVIHGQAALALGARAELNDILEKLNQSQIENVLLRGRLAEAELDNRYLRHAWLTIRDNGFLTRELLEKHPEIIDSINKVTATSTETKSAACPVCHNEYHHDWDSCPTCHHVRLEGEK